MVSRYLKGVSARVPMSYRICFAAYRSYFSPANTGGGVRCLPTIQVGCYWEHLPLPSQYISYSLDKYPILSFLLYGLCLRALFPTPQIQLSPLGQVGHALEHPTSQLGHVWEHPPPFNFMSRIWNRWHIPTYWSSGTFYGLTQLPHPFLIQRWDMFWNTSLPLLVSHTFIHNLFS